MDVIQRAVRLVGEYSKASEARKVEPVVDRGGSKVWQPLVERV